MKIYVLLFLLSSFIFLNGCSSITVLRIEELVQVEEHIDSLKSELLQLQIEIISEQKKQNELLRLIRADQHVKFGEIERSIAAIAGNISESQLRISQIDEKTRKINKRWEQSALTDSLVNASQQSEIEQLFEIALNDFTAGRYSTSISGFRDIIKRFAESSEAEKCMYWIAETLYIQNKNEEAEQEYKAYIKHYPNGEKFCVTLFKLGLLYGKMGKQQSQNLIWKNCIKRCPDSEESQAIKIRMNN